MKDNYLFTSERLGFRNWKNKDLLPFSKMNADERVMEHFPAVLSIEESNGLVERLTNHYNDFGYTYFATELLENQEFIGFIGLGYQQYETVFTPATDIGWRLKTAAWGKGYATEGAIRCLEYAFNELKLENIIATCTIGNSKSENVMQKIGMIKAREFNHPRLKDFPAYEKCMCYEISRSI